MLFNSIEYVIFLPLFFIGYWFIFKRLKLQNIFVVISSYIFYGWWDWLQSPNQKIPDRKTKCVIKTHINIKQNVIFGAKLKPV